MKSNNKIRSYIQIFFFILVLLISFNHFINQYGQYIPLISNASLHSICPFGGVVSIYQYITTGTLVKKVHESSIVLMWMVIILAIGVGPVFCGWICPFGTFQEWIGKLGKRIFKKRYNHFIPGKIDSFLRYLRYIVLIWVIYMTARSASLVFKEYDPYYTLFNLWSDEIAISGYVVLSIIIVLSFFVERPWCKYACPYGALLGLSNIFKIFKIKRNNLTCINCNKCSNVCPMNIDVANKKNIRNHQCIVCLECTSENSCPIERTVELTCKNTVEKNVTLKGE